MRIYLENEEGPELDLDYMEIANLVTESVLDYENCPYESQVELLLTNNAEIQRINNEFRGIDRPTDVLSFPMIEYDSPADFSSVEEDDSNFDLETGELILGNIVISKEKVIAQAEEKQRNILDNLGITR